MGLSAETAITRVDGSKTKVSSLQVGDEILGLDENNFIAPNHVLSIEKEPLCTEWVNLKGPRIKGSRGNSYYSLTTSINQKIITNNNKIKQAKDIKLEDLLIGLVNRINLTGVQKSILLGTVLGDGSITTSPSGTSKAVKWGHSSRQKDYLDWTVNALGGLATINDKGYLSGYGSQMFTAITKFSFQISKFFDGYNKPAGVIPESVISHMDPIALAYWYMDDGSLSSNSSQRDRIHFATYSFNEESHTFLIKAFQKFGLKAVLQHSSKGPTLRLNADDTEKFFVLIAPYVPPSMQYKLSEPFRGNTGWIPKTTVQTEKLTSPTQLQTKTSITKNRTPYLVKTQLGSFFANGIAVSG